MRRVILTGGTGLIGSALFPALRAAGYTPLVLSRRPGKEPDRLKWDGQHIPSTLSGEGVVAAINLVGASIADRRWTESYKRELWESRVIPTQNLSAWLSRYAPTARLISASAIGYYGATLSSDILTEESPPGTDFLAGLAQAWEEAAQEAPTPPTIFRIGIVLSPAGGAWKQLRRAFIDGVGAYFSPGQQGFSWIHITDVVRAFLWALEDESRRGVYNLTAPYPLSAREFAQAVLQRRGGGLLLPIPSGLIRFFMGEMAEALVRGAFVRPQRLLKEGFTFQYPTIEEALTQLLPSSHDS
ncbi:MAG: TIGR01777 family oxidoreductase [Bacteroidia bacterium]|nr:TIGR01777 family oxidoreductase [Bacteroidia bacterium]MDW8015819.1 TIGR01777 family oxidoreductase [Bacteroidia bacterium]